MPRAARSFADDLRARRDEELTALVLARPDLARPAPSDITSLAARAQTRASVQRALEHLDARSLRLVEALLVVGADGAPAALDASRRAVDAGLRELWTRALVWKASDGWRPVRPVGEILSHPASLGPPAAEVGLRPADLPLRADSTHAEREQVEASLSPRARTVIEQLRWNLPRASFTSPALRVVRDELVAARLMAPLDGGDAVIPREIGLALRGGRLFRSPWASPEMSPAVIDVRSADDAAAGEVLDLLWRIDDVAAIWDTEPPRVLRTGGVSVRDHRRTAVGIEASTELTAFILEIASAAGLLAADGEVDPAWRPTEFYDEWATWEPARRWAVLAIAWRDTTRAPSLAGQNIEGSVVNVLGKDASWPLMRARRHDVLSILSSLEPGAAPTAEEVDDLLRWRRPLRFPTGAPTRSDVVLRETGWLGLTGRGALTSAGRHLLELDGTAADASAIPDAGIPESATPMVEAMAAAIPTPVDRIMLQGDLTAIAPGPLVEEVAAFMRRAAVVESRGGATVFRITEGSLRNLLDSGLSAQEALDRFARYSLTPVPQPLEYLMTDVARRYGHLRVGSVSSYVRSDDPATLDTLLADSSLAMLQLRRLAPTVVVSPMPATTLLDVLRERRHAPVAETSDGGVVVHTDRAKRSRTPRHRTPTVQVTRLEAEAVEALVTSMRAGEENAVRPGVHDAHTRIPSSDPTVTLTALQDAAADRAPVWIGYVDATGDIKRALFRPERVEGGRVRGQIGEPGKTSSFSIHRITGVAPA